MNIQLPSIIRKTGRNLWETIVISRGGSNNHHVFHVLPINVSPYLIALSLTYMVMWAIQLFSFSETSAKSLNYFTNINLFEVVLLLSTSLYIWWTDVSNETGEHTIEIKKGLKAGMALFIVSEIMFFASFFWAYFHISWSLPIELGAKWPPLGLKELIVNPYGLPLLNTVILLVSGMTLTYAHHGLNLYYKNNEKLWNKILLLKNSKYMYKTQKKIIFDFYKIKNNLIIKKSIKYLTYTIILALIFTTIQGYEYIMASFAIADGAYGSTFYLLTGFHGIHVLVGTIFILISQQRVINENNLIKINSGVGVDCAVWYWHFVDVVWLFLYVLIYIGWGSKNNCDIPSRGGKFFQDPATNGFELLIDFHNYIMYFLLVIIMIVTAIIYKIIYQEQKISYWFSEGRFFAKKQHGTIRELIWTIIPAIILILIAMKSMTLIRYLENPESSWESVGMTIKIIGHQWYWTYDLIYKGEVIEFDSYMLDESTVATLEGLRLLEVDNPLMIPKGPVIIRFLVTSVDVLHSWAIPSLGIKVDAIPGRLNQATTIIKRAGEFYGQCSEICGVNHGFMPIKIISK